MGYHNLIYFERRSDYTIFLKFWAKKLYCGSCLSGHFEKSGFVRLDLIGSKSPLEGTRELKIEAKFAVDTGEPHKKEL